jgi:hypothetical protein
MHHTLRSLQGWRQAAEATALTERRTACVCTPSTQTNIATAPGRAPAPQWPAHGGTWLPLKRWCPGRCPTWSPPAAADDTAGGVEWVSRTRHAPAAGSTQAPLLLLSYRRKDHRQHGRQHERCQQKQQGHSPPMPVRHARSPLVCSLGACAARVLSSALRARGASPVLRLQSEVAWAWCVIPSGVPSLQGPLLRTSICRLRGWFAGWDPPSPAKGRTTHVVQQEAATQSSYVGRGSAPRVRASYRPRQDMHTAGSHA